jgi:hypothetical protein
VTGPFVHQAAYRTARWAWWRAKNHKAITQAKHEATLTQREREDEILAYIHKLDRKRAKR